MFSKKNTFLDEIKKDIIKIDSRSYNNILLKEITIDILTIQFVDVFLKDDFLKNYRVNKNWLILLKSKEMSLYFIIDETVLRHNFGMTSAHFSNLEFGNYCINQLFLEDDFNIEILEVIPSLDKNSFYINSKCNLCFNEKDFFFDALLKVQKDTINSILISENFSSTKKAQEQKEAIRKKIKTNGHMIVGSVNLQKDEYKKIEQGGLLVFDKNFYIKTS